MHKSLFLFRDGPSEPIRRHAGHYRRHQSVPGAVQRFPQNHRHPIDRQTQQTTTLFALTQQQQKRAIATTK